MSNYLPYKLLPFFILISINIVLGQTIKTYSGNYEKGVATYQYFENENYERILNGNFLYKENGYQITGQFKNNLRNGLWKATRSNKLGWSKASELITEVSIATYKNGDLDGNCSYKKVYVTKNKILQTCTATFKNNLMVGSFKFNSYSDDDKYESDYFPVFSIELFLDEKGFADSTLKCRYKQNYKEFEDIQKYKYGILYWELYRDLSDGSIISKLDKKIPIEDIGIIPEPERIEQRQIHLHEEHNTLFNAILFWNNDIYDCNNCHIYNPLYVLQKGMNITSILPLKLMPSDNNINKKDENEKTIINKTNKQSEQNTSKISKVTEDLKAARDSVIKRKEFEKSDYGKLKNTIKTKFNVWLEKTNFETTNDYSKRIKNEANEKFKSILSESIKSVKDNFFKNDYATIGEYNSEKELFPIYYKKDTAFIKIQRDIASTFYSIFSIPKRGEDHPPVYVIPIGDFVIINNKLELNKALFLFDNKWSTQDGLFGIHGFNFINNNGIYSYEVDSYGKSTNKLINIKSSTQFEKEVYYYEWQNNVSNIQSLDFTLKDLEIILPNQTNE